MPRELTIPIENWPDPQPDIAYLVRVESIRRPRKQTHLVVGLEHLDAEQEGRVREVQLPLPCRPFGLTAQFIAACGHTVEIGTSVRVKDCLGKTMIARFARTQTGALEISSFESVIPEDLYAAPESTRSDPTTAPAPEADPDGHHGR